MQGIQNGPGGQAGAVQLPQPSPKVKEFTGLWEFEGMEDPKRGLYEWHRKGMGVCEANGGNWKTCLQSLNNLVLRIRPPWAEEFDQAHASAAPPPNSSFYTHPVWPICSCEQAFNPMRELWVTPKIAKKKREEAFNIVAEPRESSRGLYWQQERLCAASHWYSRDSMHLDADTEEEYCLEGYLKNFTAAQASVLRSHVNDPTQKYTRLWKLQRGHILSHWLMRGLAQQQ